MFKLINLEISPQPEIEFETESVIVEFETEPTIEQIATEIKKFEPNFDSIIFHIQSSEFEILDRFGSIFAKLIKI